MMTEKRLVEIENCLREPRDFLECSHESVISECVIEIKRLREEGMKLRRRIRTMEQDAKEDARTTATEASWKERQGEEYGSY